MNKSDQITVYPPVKVFIPNLRTLAISIPKEVARRQDIRKGDFLQYRVDGNNRIYIEKTTRAVLYTK